MKGLLRNCSGFALIQALLAVMILSFGLAAVMAAFQQSLRLVQLRKNYLTPARELAEAALIARESGVMPEAAESNLAMMAEQNHLRYEVAASPWPAVAGVQQVRVTVSWTDRGKPGTLTVTTLLPDTVSSNARLFNLNQ